MFQISNVKDGPSVYTSGLDDLYQYTVYIGDQVINQKSRRSYWWVIPEQGVYCETGFDDNLIISPHMCVEILGYTPEKRSSTYSKGTDLPYVNGCSTKQLIPAARPGDPTFQYLLIPAGCSEQQHHIHATPRIVYVAEGSGKSIVGMGKNAKTYDLKEGDVIILGKMVPHHFETIDQDLVVLPLHIFSSGPSEFNHPMFNGTHKV